MFERRKVGREGLPVRYEGGIAALDPVKKSTDVYQAAARWWGWAMLPSGGAGGAENHPNPHGRIDMQTSEELMSLRYPGWIEQKVGGFVIALEGILRKRKEHENENPPPGFMYMEPKLLRKLRKRGFGNPPYQILSTDYRPDKTLQEAAERAGLQRYPDDNFFGVFPLKTSITIDHKRWVVELGHTDLGTAVKMGYVDPSQKYVQGSEPVHTDLFKGHVQIWPPVAEQQNP